MQNCSSSSNESMPRNRKTLEANDQKESQKQMKGEYSRWVEDSPFLLLRMCR